MRRAEASWRLHPEVFDTAHTVVESLRVAVTEEEATLAEREVELAEKEAVLIEATEAFAARLRIAQSEHQRASAEIDRDRKVLEELREEVLEREETVLRREDQATFCETEVLAGEVALDRREDLLSRGGEALAVRARLIEEDAERRVEAARKAAAEEVEAVKAEAQEGARWATDWRRRLEEVENHFEELWIERDSAISTMTEVSMRSWRAVINAGLGDAPATRGASRPCATL